jgi:hypothetical protein
LKLLDIDVSRQNLKSALYILQKFQLISEKRRSSQTFYYAVINRTDRVNLHFDSEKKRIDTATVKIAVSSYYRDTIKQNPNFRNRVKVIEAISSESEAT